jgi:2-oxo-4-hydroxy-4-carboxy-5-ureidoimidazoline decarboxylase
MPHVDIESLNALDRSAFVAICGRFFEHSPWVADRTWTTRPWASRESLHEALCQTLALATLDEKVALICAHPDLVGNAALAGPLTSESTREQSAAGLGELSSEEISLFQQYNSAYRAKFSFPFVICARENKKEAILAAFPLRLQNARDQEIATAIREIEKIAKLRLLDAIAES